jgi:hypothetical protein
VEPQQREFLLTMGIETSFMIRVADRSLQDKVSVLALQRGSVLPQGAKLGAPVMVDNEAVMHFSWTPLAADGGSNFTLCFTASDLPVCVRACVRACV